MQDGLRQVPDGVPRDAPCNTEIGFAVPDRYNASAILFDNLIAGSHRLVVIGRGRLIAETSVADFIARSGAAAVKLVTPDLAAFSATLSAAGATVEDSDGSLTVEGLTPPQIGDLAARDGLRIHELTPITASLEDAFMELTQDEVEYRPLTMPVAVAVGNKE